MKVPFPSPGSPNDLIMTCEGCGNLIYLREVDEVFPCPLCGCLNQVASDDHNLIHGRLMVTSPIIELEKEVLESGSICLPDLPEAVQEALLWLQQNNWRFGFVVEPERKAGGAPDKDAEKGPASWKDKTWDGRMETPG